MCKQLNDLLKSGSSHALYDEQQKKKKRGRKREEGR